MMHKDRPRIDIPNDQTDRLLNKATVVILLALVGYIVSIFPGLDKTIPVHLNLRGEVDSYGSKFLVLILPLIASFIYGLISILLKYPHIYNYGQQVNSENAFELYRKARKILRVVRLWAVMIVALVTFVFVQLAQTGSTKAASWLLPVILGSSLLIVAYSLYNSSKKKPISQ